MRRIHCRACRPAGLAVRSSPNNLAALLPRQVHVLHRMEVPGVARRERCASVEPHTTCASMKLQFACASVKVRAGIPAVLCCRSSTATVSPAENGVVKPQCFGVP